MSLFFRMSRRISAVLLRRLRPAGAGSPFRLQVGAHRHLDCRARRIALGRDRPVNLPVRRSSLSNLFTSGRVLGLLVDGTLASGDNLMLAMLNLAAAKLRCGGFVSGASQRAAGGIELYLFPSGAPLRCDFFHRFTFSKVTSTLRERDHDRSSVTPGVFVRAPPFCRSLEQHCRTDHGRLPSSLVVLFSVAFACVCGGQPTRAPI